MGGASPGVCAALVAPAGHSASPRPCEEGAFREPRGRKVGAVASCTARPGRPRPPVEGFLPHPSKCQIPQPGLRWSLLRPLPERTPGVPGARTQAPGPDSAASSLPSFTFSLRGAGWLIIPGLGRAHITWVQQSPLPLPGPPPHIHSWEPTTTVGHREAETRVARLLRGHNTDGRFCPCPGRR